MNGALFLDGDLASQVRGEGVHLAFLALIGGVNLAFVVVGFLLRRDLRRSDKDKEKLATDIERLDGKVDENDRRHGYEISDIKIAVAPLFAKAELDQPEYPSR